MNAIDPRNREETQSNGVQYRRLLHGKSFLAIRPQKRIPVDLGYSASRGSFVENGLLTGTREFDSRPSISTARLSRSESKRWRIDSGPSWLAVQPAQPLAVRTTTSNPAQNPAPRHREEIEWGVYFTLEQS